MKSFFIKKCCLLLSLLAILSVFGWGQTNTLTKTCGSILDTESLLYYKSKLHDYEKKAAKINATLFNGRSGNQMMDFIPIQAHIIRTNSGVTGLSLRELKEAIEVVNRQYAPANMQFELCGDINYIDNNIFYDYEQSEENALYNAHQVDNAINIFFANEVVTSDGSQLCGYAFFPRPNRKNMILMANDCVSDESTLAHELGHYFYLLHTHSTFAGKELVARTNCSTTGDFMCDTPADPGLLDNIRSNSCVYNGVGRDANGDFYQPDVTNLMSYAPNRCVDNFTQNQYSRIRYWFEETSQSVLTCEATSLISLCNSAITIAFNQPITGNTNNESDNFQVINYQNCSPGNSSDNPFNGQDKIYQFTLNSETNIEISLTGLSKDLDLFLINDCNNFNCIAASLNSNSANELVQEKLSAGTYYLIVDGYIPSEKGSYNLIVKTNGNTPPNSCFTPAGLRVTEKGYSYVKLLWDYNSENSYEQTRIKVEGGDWIYGGFQFGLGSSWAGMAPCTTYEIQINGQCGYGNGAEESDFSPSIFVTTDGCDDPYCYSNGLTYSWNNWIDRVAFNTFNNLSGNDLGYGNFTNVSTNVEKGKEYQINITPGYESFGRSSVGYRVWIDFNQDNDFEDEGEKIVEAYHFNQEILKAIITIPTSAKSGATRMRITANKDRLPEPCDLGEYSEVEDYTLIIEGETLPQATLAVNTSQLSVAANVLTATFSISSNTSWTVSENDAWIKSITPATGVNNGTININLDPNPNTANRTAIITIAGTGVNNKTVIITQEGVTDTGNNSQPDWQITSTNTGSNHTIILSTDLIIPTDCSFQSGDWIGAFYLDNGQEKCAGYGQWFANENNSFAVYGNDMDTNDKDGFAIGETFNLKAWQSIESKEIDLQVQFSSTDNIITHTNTFASNGISKLQSLACNSITSQTLNLKKGWNLVSLNVFPNTPNILTLISSVSSSIDIIKNGEGATTIPNFNINNIGNWNILEGYQIKANKAISLVVEGTGIAPQTSISIKKGWQIIPYFKEHSESVPTALSAIIDQIEIVKDNEGNNFIPAYNINNIGNMKESQGYLLKANSNAILRYQNFQAPTTASSRQHKGRSTSHYTLENPNSGNNTTLLFPKEMLENKLALNDEIGVFTQTDVLCGAAIFTGDNLAITIWGDDAGTAEIEGLVIGENFKVKHWAIATSKETVLLPYYRQGSNDYEINAINIVEDLPLLSTAITTIDKVDMAINIFPNPTNEDITIAFDSPVETKGEVQLFDLTGKLIFEKNKKIKEGENALKLSLQTYPNGVYWIRLATANRFHQPIKVIKALK